MRTKKNVHLASALMLCILLVSPVMFVRAQTSVEAIAIQDAIVASNYGDTPLGLSYSCDGTSVVQALAVGYNWSTGGPFCPTDLGVARSYIRWSLPTLPSGATLLSASISFQGAGSVYEGDEMVPIEAQIARVQSDWNEAAITYNNKPGNYSYETSFTIDESGSFPTQIDITSIAQTWYASPDQNYGLVIYEGQFQTSGANIRFFGSKDNTIGKAKPTLTITYQGAEEILQGHILAIDSKLFNNGAIA